MFANLAVHFRIVTKTSIKQKLPYGISGKVVLNCLLFLVMGLSFWTVRSSAPGTSPLAAMDGVNVALVATTDLADQPLLSISSVHLSRVTLELIEMADDSSNDDNTDIDPIEMAHHISFESALDLTQSTNLLLHLSQSVQARPSADLFMLHHCWRSFLV